MRSKTTDPKTPSTSVEWRARCSDIQAESEALLRKITDEQSRRKDLAVAASTGDAQANRDFSASFDIEMGMRHEAERTEALLSHAAKQLAAAEQAEAEAADRARREALAIAWANLSKSAAQIDELLREVRKESERFESQRSQVTQLGGDFHLRTTVVLAKAAKNAGLRELLGLTTAHSAASALHMVTVLKPGEPEAPREDAA